MCELVQVHDAHTQLKRQTDKTLDVGNDNKSENFCVNIDFCTVRPALALCGHNLTTPHWDRILPEVTLTFLLVCDFTIFFHGDFKF